MGSCFIDSCPFCVIFVGLTFTGFYRHRNDVLERVRISRRDYCAMNLYRISPVWFGGAV